LTSVELRNKLQSSLKCSLPSSLAFDYPKIKDMVNYLAKDLLILQENDSYNIVSRHSQQNLKIDRIAKELAEKLGGI